MINLGETIKTIRENKNKTQREFADELTIPQSQLSYIENGRKTSLTIEKLEFVCDYLEIRHNKKQIKQLKEGIPEQGKQQEEVKEHLEGLKTMKEIKDKRSYKQVAKTLEDRLQESEKKVEEYQHKIDSQKIAVDIYREVIELLEGAK